MRRAPHHHVKRALWLAAAIVIAAVGYGLWYYFVGSRYVSTDNAYSAAEVAEVTPSVTGIVQTVNVVDTQAVKQGMYWCNWTTPTPVWRWRRLRLIWGNRAAGSAAIWRPTKALPHK
jgi:hypothetical protein